MLKRIIEFYKIAFPPLAANATSHMHDVWRGITTVYHRPLHEAAISGDEQILLNALNNFGPNTGLWGIEMFNLLYHESDGDPRFARLRQAGVDLSIPDCFGFKFYGENGGTPTRLLPYAEAALLLKKINGDNIPEHVLELGVGVGYLGYLLHQMSARSYTVIDLPTSCIFVAWFLSKCLGESNIWLYGEPFGLRDKAFATIYPSVDCRGVGNKKYDAIFSMNCFPEIPPLMQDFYLKLFSECLSPDGFFLSINHENPVYQQRSLSIAMQQQTEFTLKSKNPTVVEQFTGNGDNVYYDEVYRLKKP